MLLLIFSWQPLPLYSDLTAHDLSTEIEIVVQYFRKPEPLLSPLSHISQQSNMLSALFSKTSLSFWLVKHLTKLAARNNDSARQQTFGFLSLVYDLKGMQTTQTNKQVPRNTTIVTITAIKCSNLGPYGCTTMINNVTPSWTLFASVKHMSSFILFYFALFTPIW